MEIHALYLSNVRQSFQVEGIPLDQCLRVCAGLFGHMSLYQNDLCPRHVVALANLIPMPTVGIIVR